MLYGLGGTLLGAVGIACLYSSWKEIVVGKTWLVPAGWLLLIVATACWIFASGAEFGISYSLLTTPLFAWGIAIASADIREQKERNWEQGQARMPGMQTLLRHTALFVAAVPIAGAAAILISVALVSLLPWQKVNAMVAAVLLVPIFWGAASYWICADVKRVRPLFWLTLASGASALLIYL